MIDLTQYEELTKVLKQAQKIERERDKNFNKAKRINFDDAIKNIRKFSEPCREFQNTIFAKTAYEVLTNLNPILVEHRTGKKLKFSEVFGEDFEKLTEDMVIHVYKLVNELSVNYKFEEETKRLDGKIIKGGDYERPCQLGFETPIWRNGEEIERGYEFGAPLDVRSKMTPEQRRQSRLAFQAMSDRERAEYMNNNYGMKYKLKDYSNDKPRAI